ncbi:MAG: Maf family protein [Puniceicoccales bacterium]|nr:Maf family protein [Puniceicoccales bacterium]
MPRFILASASPRRQKLLAHHGFFPEIIPAQVIEHEDPDADPQEMVLHNASLKALHLAERNRDALVLGADTTVALGEFVLNKPTDLDEARAMLRRLSGRVHTVYTGVALVWRERALNSAHCITSHVRFKTLDDATISTYFQIVNPLDKAGAYGIQEGRDLIIEDYEEPISNIMGLPVEWVAEQLAILGITPRTKA